MSCRIKRGDLSAPFPTYAAEIGGLSVVCLKKQLTFPPIPDIMSWLKKC